MPFELHEHIHHAAHIIDNVRAAQLHAGLQDDERHLLNRAFRAVGMNGGERAGMAGVDRAQERIGLRPPQLAKNDPVRPHPKRRLQQIIRRHPRLDVERIDAAIFRSNSERGNLTSSGSATYGYDAVNHLSNSNSAASSFEYGSLDELQGFNTTSGTYLRFASDGTNIIGEYLWGGSPAPLRRYVYGPGDDEPLVWYEGTGTTDKRWLVQDERGSVVAVTNASGLATAINSYDEYGIPAATNIGRFQYTGQAWLPEIGLYYYKARMYSPTLGRFLQTDPIGYADGLNWYNYVGSDPVNGRDPSGLEEDEIVITEKRFKATESFSNFDLGGGGFSFGSSDPCSGPLGVLCGGGGGTSGEAGEILVTAARVGKRGTPGAGPQKVTVDKSCPAGGPSYDPGVQAKALEAQRRAFSAQQRNPSGPPFREYGFTGRPYLFPFLFGPGFVTSDIIEGSQSNIDLNPGSLDNFDVHTHSQATGPSGPDVKNTPSGYTTMVIGRDKTIRCYTGQ